MHIHHLCYDTYNNLITVILSCTSVHVSNDSEGLDFPHLTVDQQLVRCSFVSSLRDPIYAKHELTNEQRSSRALRTI